MLWQQHNPCTRHSFMQGKLKQLDERFDNNLEGNWGLETLVNVGESWLPAMLEQVGRPNWLLLPAPCTAQAPAGQVVHE